MPDLRNLPSLDRNNIVTRDKNYPQLCQDWIDNGYVILPKFFTDEELEPYINARTKWALPSGYWGDCPYLYVPTLRKLVTAHKLSDILDELIGEPMGVHLNLTSWVSTNRGWHQDDYLNPPNVNCWHLAVCIALDDIHRDSGPFEYVPGSHKWPLMRQDKVKAMLKPEQAESPMWSVYAEALLDTACEQYIHEQGAKPKKFMAKKGDVLIWHARLMHRDSKARCPRKLRKAVISHYSSIYKRADFMANGWFIKRDEGNGPYFYSSNHADMELRKLTPNQRLIIETT